MIHSSNSYSDFRVRKALQILDREPNQAVSAVAQRLRLSRSRFSHLFKAQTGTSVKSYVVSRRLHEAVHLLRTTGMEIKEIAYRLGYQHRTSFARVFKAQIGVTPNQYRKAEGFAAAMDPLNLVAPTLTPENTLQSIPAVGTTRSTSLRSGSLAS